MPKGVGYAKRKNKKVKALKPGFDVTAASKTAPAPKASARARAVASPNARFNRGSATPSPHSGRAKGRPDGPAGRTRPGKPASIVTAGVHSNPRGTRGTPSLGAITTPRAIAAKSTRQGGGSNTGRPPIHRQSAGRLAAAPRPEVSRGGLPGMPPASTTSSVSGPSIRRARRKS